MPYVIAVRRFLIVLVAILLPQHAARADSSPAPASRPNIIFILADDLGYGDVGCFGQKRIKTPSMDKMAVEGMKFTSCYAGSTVCAPSRCTLMTGLHTGHCRIRGNANNTFLHTTDTTVAEILKKAGYRNSLIGKWGLGEEGSDGLPNKKGFDESFGYLNQTHAHDYYTDYLIKDGKRVTIEGNLNNGRKVYSHDLFATAALEFLDKNQHGPFFLYLAFTIPHMKMEVPSDEPYAKENWPQSQKNKAAMITHMDKDIGRVFDKLKELHLDENTIVFFSSDNGPHHEGVDPTFFNASGPFRGIKRDLYEGGIREPTIVRWPGKIKAGTESDFAWAFWDFLPTACDLIHVKAPEKLDGFSIVPTLFGQSQPPHEFMYWEFHEGGSKQAVRMGQWKALRLVPGQPLELYDLKTDPGEKHNVAAEHPDEIAKIETYLKTARTESKQWPIKAKDEQPLKPKKKKAA